MKGGQFLCSVSNSEMKPNLKWWNNGWIALSILIVVYLTLFIVGKKSIEDEQFDPVYDGASLSEWASSIEGYNSFSNYDAVLYKKAGEVLKKNHQALTSVLVGWVDGRDTGPEQVYFFTRSRFDRVNGRYLQDDYGARSRQLKAAKIILLLNTGEPSLVAALERNIDCYEEEERGFAKGTDHLTEIYQKAIRKQYRLLGYRFE